MRNIMVQSIPVQHVAIHFIVKHILNTPKTIIGRKRLTKNSDAPLQAVGMF